MLTPLLFHTLPPAGRVDERHMGRRRRAVHCLGWFKTNLGEYPSESKEGIDRNGLLASWSSDLQSPWRRWPSHLQGTAWYVAWKLWWGVPLVGELGSPTALQCWELKQHHGQNTDGWELMPALPTPCSSGPRCGDGPSVPQSPELILCLTWVKVTTRNVTGGTASLPAHLHLSQISHVNKSIS